MIKLNKNNPENDLKTKRDFDIRSKYIIILSVICGVSLAIRLFYFPFDIPITLDGVDYFSYAMELSRTGSFPHYQNFSNNGWPSFLSIFFSLYKSGNLLDYMQIQRYLSVAVSVITILPIYLLCRRFFSRQYAILGAVFFAFDPRLITNSLLGLTDTFFVLLGITSFYLFLSKNIKAVYASFGLVALAALVRYEGLLLIIPFSVMFFVRFRHEKETVAKYFIAFAIFLLILLPMAYIRVQTTGSDGLTSQLMGGSDFVSKYVIQGIPEDDDPVPGTDYQNKASIFASIAITNLMKYVAWVNIPILMFFVPVGLFLIAKNRSIKIPDHRISTMILISLFVLIPAFYAYGRGIQETRYLFLIFPLFYLISIYAVKKVSMRIWIKKVFFMIIIVGVVLASIGFLEYKKIDYEHEREAFLVAKEIVKVATGINNYSENKYIKPAELEQNWPSLPQSKLGHVALDIVKIPISDQESLEQFIADSKPKGLTHLVVDDSKDNPAFLMDIITNNKRYDYLTKVYDSEQYGMNYDVRIYKIDYERFSYQHTN